MVAEIREFKIAVPTRHFWSYESTYILPRMCTCWRIFMRFPSIRLRLHKPQHGHFPAAARRECIKHRDTRVFLRSSISERICSSRERYLPPLYELYIRISYTTAKCRDPHANVFFDALVNELLAKKERKQERVREREKILKKHLISYRVIEDTRLGAR